nr:DUF4102 domain-containing protein [Sphingobium sp.]
MFVAATGTKSWRYKYDFGGKERLLTIGRFPEIKSGRRPCTARRGPRAHSRGKGSGGRGQAPKAEPDHHYRGDIQEVR